MGAAFFYHLTETPLDDTLPMIVARARDQGWRVLLRGTEAATVERLDRVLWEGAKDSFLPHGLAGGPHDADQPVLLGVGIPAEGFDCVISVEGADLTPAEVGLAARACVIFDGADGDAITRARAQWKALTDAGCAAQYWAQDGGRWTKKAETG